MRVEFQGIPRERAGIAALELNAGTFGELLTALERRFPTFIDVVHAGCLRPPFIAHLNGSRFIRDPRTPLSPHDHLLIFSPAT